MNFIKVLLLIFLFACCAQNKEEEAFENDLGKENSETLNYLVSAFEKDFLKKQYPKLKINEAYRKFLEDLRDGNTNNWKERPAEAVKIFNESKLRLEIYNFPDSIWVVPNSTKDKIEEDSLSILYYPLPYIKYRRKDYIDSIGKQHYLYSRSYVQLDSLNTDSIINYVKKIREFRYDGEYFKLIDRYKNKNSFWSEMNEYVISLNNENSKVFAQMILKNNFDLNNPTVRKFIVLECVY
ncbi:hypothetical protein POV26_08910 [Aequorivita todarodis]|uniref:hypothetical protein n=1 Tax=Aequorivita todarodis TaxID=2036821 RepID=UPI002350AC5E|nr:hypothetical protein [Aequorivita todarodis]MDC8001156.1 hypothetical protein [Aequorivita todarodis]